MIFLSSQVAQWLIIIGAVFFFVIPFLINRNIKVPKGTVLPDKCHSCSIEGCLVKSADPEEVKKELRAELEKCEVPNEKN
ncbi:MAG: hypothetical protein PHY42_06150 [Bacilli bacterium]|jgi:hypothetical protein|nr:hypothetical protein [Bacilli bacterium]